jgi:hypothetical protein
MGKRRHRWIIKREEIGAPVRLKNLAPKIVWIILMYLYGNIRKGSIFHELLMIEHKTGKHERGISSPTLAMTFRIFINDNPDEI